MQATEIRGDILPRAARASPFVGTIPTHWTGYPQVKRCIDVGLSLCLLLLLSIPMILIALAVKVCSPGPVLFRQRRIGKDGSEFCMLKFRTMYANSDSNIHRDHVRRLICQNTNLEDMGSGSLKLKSDPRVTRVGKILRVLSLDELPQLFNVIKGDMSLVGPRPPLSYEYELYSERDKQRLAVLPGITGYWQVTGRNHVSFQEMVNLDLIYIATMSLGLDLWIIARTPYVMITGRGGG